MTDDMTAKDLRLITDTRKKHHSSAGDPYCDKPREECGVFGMMNADGRNVAKSVYYGLCALQHRGQESAGIAVCDTKGPAGNITYHKDMGLVSEVFKQETLEKLEGDIGIGHVRYSTTGESSVRNAQPLVLNYLKGTLGLVYNGNLVNTESLRLSLQQTGAIFHTTSDSEVIACQIAKERTRTTSAEEAVKNAAKLLKGGFALIVMSPRKLIGVRDPYGLKPLCLGKLGDSYILSSESCAFSCLNAKFVRDILPGETVTVTKEGVKSDMTLAASDIRPGGRKIAHCVFEYIYFARLDSAIDGVNVYDARIKAGEALAASYPVEADVVVGVPDSGLTAAVGYARKSGIPFAQAFQKNSYVGRTFIKPTQEERETAVQLKLSVLKTVVDGKRVVLIDDSIVRGTTMAGLIHMLKGAGAAEVHVRISSPPFLHPCFYGTDVPGNGELIAHAFTPDEICDRIGADSLGYLDIDDLDGMTEGLSLCKACFDGKYPVL